MNYGNVSFTIRLGVFQSATSSVENFDTTTVPNLPAGWTVTATGGATAGLAAWRTNGLSSDKSALAGPTTTVSENLLDSANIAIVSQTAQISFLHRWNMEADATGFYDGGVLEISIGGGAFADILAAGGSFAAGGYTGTIAAGFGNALAGRQAWSGFRRRSPPAQSC